MILNKWIEYKKGKYSVSYYLSSDLKGYAEFGILFENNPCFAMWRKCWQLRICLGWFRVFFVKYHDNQDTLLK